MLAAALLPAACGDGTPSGSAPGAPGGGPGPAAKIDWDPRGLLPVPSEIAEPPGSGTSWLTGRVVDEEGNPVAGAEVQVHAAPKMPTALRVLHAAAVAGPDGAFRVGPGPTPWARHGILSAAAPGFARTALCGRALAAPGTEFSQPDVEARIVLRRGQPVTGRVHGKDGRGPDAPLVLAAFGPPNFMDLVPVDAEGRFSFRSPEGNVTVLLVDGVHPAASTDVEVKAGAPCEADLVVERGRDVRGRVLDAATGEPVPGAWIHAYWGESRVLPVDAKGEFLLPRYWYRAIQVYAPGYAERTHEIPADAGEAGREPQVVRLVPGLVVRGRAEDLEGKPLPQARLNLFTRAPGSDWAMIPGPRSGADGAFTFVGVPVAQEGMSVRLFGLATEFAFGSSDPVSGPPGGVVEGVKVRLPHLVDVAGRLEDEHGLPLPARVSVEWDPEPALRPFAALLPGRMVVDAGADGRWRARLPEGVRFRVVVEDDAIAVSRGEGTAPAFADRAGAGTEVPPVCVVKVLRGLSIRGVAHDAAGRPLTAGEIRVEPSPPTDPRPSRDGHVRRDGTFEVGGLTEGAYDMSVVDVPRFLPEVVRDLRAGATGVDVAMRRAGGLRGRIVLPGPADPGAVTEIAVLARGDSRPLPPRTAARVQGSVGKFAMGPLTPGAYTLTALSGRWRLDLENLAVKDGQVNEIGDIALAEGGAVEGTVTAAGKPAAGAAVEVLRVLGGGGLSLERTVASGSDGRYRVEGLARGPHVVGAAPRDRPRVEVRFDSVPGRSETADLAAALGARLVVRVRDHAGRPVAGARVVLSGPAGSLVFWREGSAGPGPHSTDDEGTLRCTGIPAGEVRVSVDKPGTGDGTASCRVEDGGTATVELELAAPR